MWYSHTTEYYTAVKIYGVHLYRWMKLKNMLNKRSPTQMSI